MIELLRQQFGGSISEEQLAALREQFAGLIADEQLHLAQAESQGDIPTQADFDALQTQVTDTATRIRQDTVALLRGYGYEP